MLSVRALTDHSALTSIVDDWNRLAAGIPFRQWDWCQTWWKHYGQDHQLFAIAVMNGTQCIGIAPFFIANQEPLGHVLRIFGEGEACSDYLSILAMPEDRERVAIVLADWLQRTHESRECQGRKLPQWDLMELDGLDSECPSMRVFLQRMETNGFGVRVAAKVNTWRLPLPPSIEEYAAQLSKQSRRKIRTALKRCDAGECRVLAASTENEFNASWGQLVELHQRRRNSKRETGCFSSSTFTDFLLEVATAFKANGQLDLVRVSIGDSIVAAELCFRGKETTFAYQLGIDPNSLKENPGWLVNAAVIRRAIAQGQSAFDWCRGDEEYKRRMGASPIPCLRCRVVPPAIRSQLWNAALVGQSTVKEWLKTGLNVTGIRL